MEKEKSGEKELERELEALYMKVESSDRSEDAAGPEPPPGPQVAEPGSPVTSLPAESHDAPIKAAGKPRISRGLAGAVLIVLILVPAALFFWPTIYHYEALNLGGEVYPLRINRLTGKAAYFDGVKWLRPPAFMAYRKPASGGGKTQPPAATGVGEGGVKSTAAASAAETNRINPRSGGKYAVQLRAFPAIEEQIARAFAGEVRKKLPDIHVETVHIQGRGVWHRILFGNFESRGEASISMKKHNLANLYPGSFVQRKSEVRP